MIKLINRKIYEGIIVEDFKGVSEVARKLGISRVAAYKTLKH